MLITFSDTNVLVAMFCFPVTPAKLSLAHELWYCLEENELKILITRAVAEEFSYVVARSPRFSQYSSAIQNMLTTFDIIDTAAVDASTFTKIQAVCQDPNDVDITASAISLKDTHDYHYLVSNDIKNFHNDEMKAYLAEHGITPLTMFGLLKLLGKR